MTLNSWSWVPSWVSTLWFEVFHPFWKRPTASSPSRLCPSLTPLCSGTSISCMLNIGFLPNSTVCSFLTFTFFSRCLVFLYPIHLFGIHELCLLLCPGWDSAHMMHFFCFSYSIFSSRRFIGFFVDSSFLGRFFVFSSILSSPPLFSLTCLQQLF